jgi:hypothetical protein
MFVSLIVSIILVGLCFVFFSRGRQETESAAPVGPERFLIVIAVSLGVGIMLASVWVLITYGGMTFQMIEDRVSGWLERVL